MVFLVDNSNKKKASNECGAGSRKGASPLKDWLPPNLAEEA